MSSDVSPPENGESKNIITHLLNAIEWAGNKLPDPAVLFLLAMFITWGLSLALSYQDFPNINPKTEVAHDKDVKKLDKFLKKSGSQLAAATFGLPGSPMGIGQFNTVTVLGSATAVTNVETIKVKNLLTPNELVHFLVVMVTNFTGFKPLGIVLVAMLGVGVAEHTGFINALIKAMLGITPNQLLTPMLLLVAIVSHTAGDTGYVLVIPLGGIIFAAAGRHPLAGIVCAFAGVSGGFSANFIPSGLDPLLQGFTQTAAQLIDPAKEVNPLCNWFFMTASCLIIVAVGWFLTDRVIEPKLRGTPVDGDPEDVPKMDTLTDAEKRGMIAGLALFGLLTVLLIAALCFRASPFLSQNPKLSYIEALTDFHAPIMESIVPLIFLFFLLPGILYGYVAGTIKNHRDIIKGMTKSMSSMGYYMVMAFFAAQFIYAFGRSNLGMLLAVSGADFLKSLGMRAEITIIGILILSSIINLLVGSASAKWALIGPIFVPMLMPLGLSPELTQAAYRIGDSSTNIITPLMPYFPLIVVYAQRYVKKTGIGTMISLMLPYSICFLVTWTVLLLLFWQIRLPLGLPPTTQFYP